MAIQLHWMRPAAGSVKLPCPLTADTAPATSSAATTTAPTSVPAATTDSTWFQHLLTLEPSGAPHVTPTPGVSSLMGLASVL